MTKIKNGTCSKSNPEEYLYEILLHFFTESDIQRQVPVIRQWVDFYIKSINLYIQVDGIYWHGLNRDLETIKLGKTTQDKKIYKQILRDEKLNKYIKDNNISLLRITDEELKSFTKEQIITIIKREK